MIEILKRVILVLCLVLTCCISCLATKKDSTHYKGGHKNIRYTGRVDRSTLAKPKLWSSGSYIDIRISGTYCILLVNDEVLWNKVHNYIEIIVDGGMPRRIQLNGKENRIVLAEGLQDGKHTITVAKDTESENGYIEITGVICKKLLSPIARKKRKIEFIGDSITCGFGADETEVSCGKGEWYDQHNAWKAYGPATARALDAEWHLSAVSGIGLIHSCCNKKILMPQVYDKINMAGDSLNWDFKKYQPDVVTVCLGQNDGVQDSTAFCGAYVQFAKRLRNYYPKATIIFLTSPMAGPQLNAVLKNYTTAVRDHFIANGDRNVGSYAFSKRSIKGCSGHPTLEEQQVMADELTSYIRQRMKW